MWTENTTLSILNRNNNSSHLPSRLYRAQQVRELDRIAIEEFDDPGISLMEHAGNAVFSALRLRWPRAKRIAVLCGIGNNGGDGFVVARLADHLGIRVVIYLMGNVENLKGDALTAYERLEGTHVEILHYGGQPLDMFDLIVDAMLGTGLKGEVKGGWRLAIDAINIAANQSAAVVACDIPSGLHADTGCILGSAVNADLTVTFIGLKQGLLTARGPDCCGEIVFDDLQVQQEIYNRVEHSTTLLSLNSLRQILRPRHASTHKGQCGHILIVGGNQGMSGAVRMSAEAAYRAGAGLVTVATHTSHAHLVNLTRPELMSYGVGNASDLRVLLHRADIVVIGPGLGKDRWAQDLLSAVLESKKPLIVDADALNLLSMEPQQRANWVLTPHPGEAATLLKITSKEIQADRFQALRSLQEYYGGVAVLKGCGTLVQDESGQPSLCPYGNPGMASGGMGDVLTGIIAGLAAQGVSLIHSAELGVCIHAYAADMAAENAPRGLLASDLFPYIRQLVNA